MSRRVARWAHAAIVLAAAVGGCSEDTGAIALRSAAFAEGGTIPERYSCEGENESPPLSWSGVDRDAEELALVMADFDGPGGIFHHWVVVGIDADTRSMDAGRLPPGAVLAQATSENTAYIGPCPPVGERREYVFTLFQLSRPLRLPAGVPTKEALDAIDAARLPGEGELRGTVTG